MPAESGMAGISTIEPGGSVVTLPAPLKAPIKDLLRMYRRFTGNQQEQVGYQSSMKHTAHLSAHGRSPKHRLLTRAQLSRSIPLPRP
jgi:hypothetical protein